MKIDEAISLLKQYIDYNNPDIPDFYTMEEACEVVIKALEQQPTDIVTDMDCVSRQLVLKQTYNWSKDEFLRVTNPFDYLRKRINSLPSVTPQPCGDCISCDAVMHILDEVGGDFDSPREAVVPIDYIADMVSELPFVTAQPKMGYWFIDERPESDREVICSNCDKPIFKYHKLDFDYRPKYCPNCGAKMQEVEE